MYADDLTLLSPTAKGLQKLLDICSVYAQEYDILFNIEKSVCLYFEFKKFKLLNVPHVLLDGRKLDYHESHKVLGMVIECTGSDKQDISRQIRGLYCRGNMLLRKFSQCSDNVKRQLFISYCTNMYCFQLWSQFTLAQMQKLRVAYNNIFRRFFRLPPRCSASEMFVHSDVPTLDMLLRKSVYSFEQRVKHSRNALLSTVCGSDLTLTNELWLRWDSVLHLKVC